MFFGLSLTETNEIVDKKIKIEFESLQDKAFEMIKKRSEDFENKYLYTQNRDNPEGLMEIANPEFYDEVFNAKNDYAKTGDIDLGNILINLLVERSKQKIVIPCKFS